MKNKDLGTVEFLIFLIKPFFKQYFITFCLLLPFLEILYF